MRVLTEDTAEHAADRPWAPAGAPKRRYEEEVWILDDVIDGNAPVAGGRGQQGPRRRSAAGRPPAQAAAPATRARRTSAELPPDVLEEITLSSGPEQAGRVAERLAAAASAYERDRYQDALRMTRTVVALAPRSATALELHGLVSYRLGHWRDALRYLGLAADVAGADESQIPVLMDCHRALRHRRKVRELWEELRASSPPADVLVEGRLVLAATLRDEGKLDEAIAELVGAGAARSLRHPSDRHVRQWYLLADLYERAGDMPRAREFFTRVVDADPELADAAERLAGIGRPARGGGTSGRPRPPKDRRATR